MRHDITPSGVADFPDTGLHDMPSVRHGCKTLFHDGVKSPGSSSGEIQRYCGVSTAPGKEIGTVTLHAASSTRDEF